MLHCQNPHYIDDKIIANFPNEKNANKFLNRPRAIFCSSILFSILQFSLASPKY